MDNGRIAIPPETLEVAAIECIEALGAVVARVLMLWRSALATLAADGRGLILPLVRVLKVSTNPCAQTPKGPEVSRFLQAE